MTNADQRWADEFVQLWTRHSRGLYAYIMSLVFDLNLAEDILQETAAVAWKQFGEFTPGTNFHAWTSQIAFNKALSALKQRRHAVPLDLEALKLLSEEALSGPSDLDRQLEHLHACLQSLNGRDRDLLRLRYGLGEDVGVIASKLNRSASAVYKALERIHESLFNCVSRKLRQEAAL